MENFKRIFSYILLCAILISSNIVPVYAQSTAAPSETDPFVKNYYIGSTDQSAPFFDVVLPEIAKNIKENNKHSISPYYDNFPKANNPENFQGLGSTTYADINGKTVTAEAFYRVRNESLCDPNNGMGLLIYQCIQYKRAHPEEDVKITFSSYRTSATAAVCVLPQSKYYGYMRSLYGTNYDEHGFVRISYMLTEAARMGIEVTMVNQLNSYAVNQYNPATGKLQSRSPLSYTTYFETALNTKCYDQYAPGKKVSDFMDFTKVGWTVEDKTSDMQHVKSCTVSHYLATDGTEHTSAVFFGSANLDDNSYIGANGNNGSQSGVIVSDHDDLYRVTYNYTRLMYEYRGQEDMFELRKLVNQLNETQAALIKSGRGDEIPADEQIIYLGTENDPVFEMYFTPFGGGADTWDTEHNPFCKYIEEFSNSTDYVEFIWNEFGYGDCHIGEVMSKKLEKAFCENPNVKNKFAIRVTDFDSKAISNLRLGTEIGYCSIKDGTAIHSKDILMSYEQDGKRHNVSLLTSCNFYMIAFSYRTNSLLVINETEKSGGNFYDIMGEKYSYGMINNDLLATPSNLVLELGESYQLEAEYVGTKDLTWTTSNKSVATVSDGKITTKKVGTSTITVTDGDKKSTVKLTVVKCGDCARAHGISCNINEQYVLSKNLGTTPLTFETVISVEQDSLTGTTTLFGNDGNFDPAWVFSLNKYGQPRVAIREKSDYYNQAVYVFDQVNVATGEDVHLSITINRAKKKMHCYVNGVLKQTITGIADFTPFGGKNNPVIGGDHLNGNATYFPGVIKSLAVWSDLHISTDVATDYSKGVDVTDKNLLAYYDFERCNDCMVKDLSANANDLEHVVLWQNPEDVEPVTDYEYSFAVVGDTQTMCENDPEAMESIYDWILENKDSQKIEYVIGLGDITDDSTDTEWENANKFISKLDGKIPYVLSRGNHDDWDDFNRNLHNGFYETTIDGMMDSGDVELTDPNQPGLVETVLPDGTTAILTREGDVPEGGTVQGDLTNSYRYFNIQGTDYLILTLDFAPSEEMLAWANDVIKAHPEHRVIVVTHAYMYRDGTTIDENDCYPPTYYTGYDNPQNGDDMWEKCFSKHENVLMVLSGHDPWQHVVYRQDKGVNDNIVTQMLIDAQYVDRNIGSTAMVAMLYFSNDGNTLTVRYYSVEKDSYGSVASQFTIELDHSYKTFTTAATTSKDGSIVEKCTQCGKVISEKSIKGIESIKLSETSYTYNATVRTPTVTVKDKSGKTLKEGTDYSVKYPSDRKSAGTYKVTVTMKGNYSGTKTLTFKINPISVSKCSFKLSTTSYTYNGKVRTPNVTVKNAKGTKLTKGTHYTVTYASGRKSAGTYKVTVKMKGNYSGTKTLSFKIKPISISSCKVTLSATSYTYNGKVKKPTVKVVNTNGTTLKDVHYTVTYASGRKNVGTYKVTIKMKGNYSGTKTLTFKINPPKTTVSKLTAGKKSITVAITKKSTQVTGYQIQYSTSKKFTNAKTKTITSYKTTKYTLKSLSAKKTYYVRVRTYKTVNGKKYYSGWSTIKYVKTK